MLVRPGFALLALLLAAPAQAAPRVAAPDPAALRAVLAGAPAAPALTPDRLRDYFAAGPRTLDLFCARARACQGRAPRRELYALFFRGSFARPPLAATGGPAAANAAATTASPVNTAATATPAENPLGLSVRAAATDAVASTAATTTALTAAADVDAAYAAQAAAYFTEPGYACRRPLTARVLETLWQLPPAAAACPATVPFLLADGEGRPELRQVDPARVAAVHLLFAGAAGQGMSSFGHVSLRLVVCAPARAQVDARCDEDLDEHLAIGFRAAVDEFKLSLRKGITGGYPLRLFAEPFMTLYDTYTVREFRPLTSLPLRLDAAQRELLVRSLAEVHWAYGTDYRFFTHNCASELSWLLRVVGQVAGARPPWLDGANVRPDRLFARARRSPAFDNAVLADLRQAEHDGFYFPGSGPYLQLALDTVARRAEAAGSVLPAHDFESFSALDAATRRRLFHAAALAQAPGAAPLPAASSATVPSAASPLLPAAATAAAAPLGPGTAPAAASPLVLAANAAPLPLAASPAAAAPDPGRERVAHAALVLEAWMEQRARRELLAALAHYYLGLAQELLARTDFFTPAERGRLARCLGGLAQPLVLGASDGLPAAPALPESGCDLGAADMQATLERLFALSPPPAHEERQLAELRATVDTVDWLAPQTGLEFLSHPRHDGDRP